MIKNFYLLLKQASGDDRKHSYGCLMLTIKVPNWENILNLIPQQDLYIQQEGYGKQQNSHVTILYGLHDDQIDQNKLQQQIQESINQPIKIKLKNLSLFQGDNPYDVLKFQVQSQKLHQLNKKFSKYPNTNKYPEYKPHMTVAYIKKGLGKKYIGQVSKELFGYQIQYSKANDQRLYFKCK